MWNCISQRIPVTISKILLFCQISHFYMLNHYSFTQWLRPKKQLEVISLFHFLSPNSVRPFGSVATTSSQYLCRYQPNWIYHPSLYLLTWFPCCMLAISLSLHPIHWFSPFQKHQSGSYLSSVCICFLCTWRTFWYPHSFIVIPLNSILF